MLEKPNLPDGKITACLHQHYSLVIAQVQFLPLGYDSSAWVYRVESTTGDAYFLKVRRGELYPPAFLIPPYLISHGIPQAVAPLPTINQGYWADLEDFHLILYPFIEGDSGLRLGMSEEQWRVYGTCIKRLHSTRLPSELAEQIPRETFVSTWLPKFRALHQEVMVNEYTDPLKRELAAFWRGKRREIEAICNRVDELSQTLPRDAGEFVLCHADIHTGNVLLDRQGGLHIVDWDQPLLAPKERDLMFIGAGVAEIATPAQVNAFYQGYGEAAINSALLAYYRYEWAVQDMGDFSARVFLWDMGEETRRDAVECFCSLFEPGRIVETAYRADRQER